MFLPLLVGMHKAKLHLRFIRTTPPLVRICDAGLNGRSICNATFTIKLIVIIFTEKNYGLQVTDT